MIEGALNLFKLYMQITKHRVTINFTLILYWAGITSEIWLIVVYLMFHSWKPCFDLL